MKKLMLILSTGLALAACAPTSTSSNAPSEVLTASSDAVAVKAAAPSPELSKGAIRQGVQDGTFKQATFAGGCFWCVESDFEKLNGVVDAVSGYTGGRTKNPNYKSVSFTETGHFELRLQKNLKMTLLFLSHLTALS